MPGSRGVRPPASGRPLAPPPGSPLLEGLPPVLDPRVRLVVLGSFPGAASLAAGRYYAHPRNHFWPIVSALLGEPLVEWPYPERLVGLLRHGVGLWDVHARCCRPGSLDADIENAEPNDLAGVLGSLGQLRGVAHNGGESARAMRLTRALGVPVWRLPSSSPANASWSLARKVQAWREPFAACGLTVPAGDTPAP